MTNDSLDAEISSLKAQLLTELEGIKNDKDAKLKADKDVLIAKLVSMSTEVNQELVKEDLEKADLTSLGVLERTLAQLLEARTQPGGPTGGIVPRGEPIVMNRTEKTDLFVRAISHGFNLPVEDTEKYAQLCEQVRMEHWAEGLKY